MKRYRIFPGRFQPPHRDHVALVEQLCADDDPLYVGVVFDSPGAEVDRRFSILSCEARRQHEPNRCPFSVAERLALWRDIIDARQLPADRIFVIGLVRPEAAWHWVTSMFPGRRTWVVPDAGEAFDDLKAEFFAAQGDTVVRPRQVPTTDGRIVRELLGTPQLADHVLESTARLIETMRKEMP